MANFAPKRNATLISGTTYPTLLRFLPLLPESIRADAVRARWRHNQIFWDEYRLPNYLSNGTPLVSRFLVLVDLRLKCSLSSGIICGSLSQRCCRLSANRVVSRPRTPSCFWATKSQDEAWLTEKANPQVQLLGRSSKGRLQRIRSASLNSCLFRDRPCSRRGNDVRHELAPLSPAWFT